MQKKGISQCVVVTGISGAGKTTTLKVLEDFGFFAIDNLPPALLPQLLHLLADNQAAIQTGVAVTIDLRSVSGSEELIKIIEGLEATLPSVRILFLDSSDESLIRRFEQTRRSHPLSRQRSIQEGIRRERELMAPILAQADLVIDTSFMDLQQHRQRLLQEFAQDSRNGVSLLLTSFGFKYGVPQDCNYVFDVRFLSNPFYVPELKPLSGEDPEIQEYLKGFPATHDFLAETMRFLDFVVPHYLESVKSQMHVAVGCTGGRHRSVAVARWLYEHCKKKRVDVGLIHRDWERGSA
ncbi:MAG: RNase adapter RapZ [Fretibacterium sp.]|nr:RNase adapter RapZ [Fretibacterium sp.]